MMVVCSTSRVKPKGSPFELLSFFISSHTAAGEFSPSLVLRLHGEWTGLGQWRKSTTEGYGERDCRASICSHHFLLFPLTWKIESLTWEEKKKFNFVMGCRCNKNAGTTAEAGATPCDDSCSCMSYQFSLIFCTLFHQGIMNAAVPRILCAHLTHEFSFVSGKNDFVKGR